MLKMKKFQKIVIIFTIFFVLASLSASAVSAQQESPDKGEYYRENLLNAVDGTIRAIRLNHNVTENRIRSIEKHYQYVFNESLGTKAPSLSELQGDKEQAVKTLANLKNYIKEKAEEENIQLHFIYKYSILIILGVSFGLAIIVSFVSRTVVDWDEVNRVRDKQSELQDKLKEAKNENDSKKVHKLEKKQQEFMQEHMGTMFSPMKTMIIIIIPFIIVFQLLSRTYGGWVVAWLPFRLPWPDISFFLFDRFFKGPVVSLGFFGWYLLSYFGFSQIWRKILVPGQ